MRATIGYDFTRLMYFFYLGTNDTCVYREDGELKLQRLKPGDEMIPFMQLTAEEYMAIKDAIITRESPQIADRNFLVAALDRERETSDRLLTLVEQGWAG